MADQGDEGCAEKELKDRVGQIHAVNELASKEKVTQTQRLRTHNKVVDGLGDDMARTRLYTNNQHVR